MKNIILLLCGVFAFQSQCVMAQKLKVFSNSKVHAVNQTYLVKPDQSNKHLTLVNSSNQFTKKMPRNLPPDLSVREKDQTAMKKAFSQVFSNTRLTQLLQEKAMLINFYVAPSGEILEVSFILDANTSITANEIEALERALKQNVSFQLYGKNLSSGDFYNVGQVVKFSSLL